MKTAEEFIREKIREKNSFPKNYVMEGLQHYSVTGEDCLRWAQEFANQDKWVSVEEGAPSKSGLYLTILAETEDQYIAYYKSNRNQFEIYGLGRVQPVTDMNVTHWQPLPTFNSNK